MQDVDEQIRINDYLEEQNEVIDTESDSINKVQKMQYVSAMQYNAHMLFDKKNSYLHHFGKLFHQYIDDQYLKMELSRFIYFRHNQDTVRAEKYQHIKNSKIANLGDTI